jgi:N-terminal half of MaoC dehydratase
MAEVTKSILPEAAKQYIGLETAVETACGPIESGAVRRYAHANMDSDPIYAESDAEQRYGGAVAPLIYPTHMFRRAFTDPDPLAQSAANADYDGSSVSSTQGLPEIEPIKHLSILNGGASMEFFRYARHGEMVKLRSRYADISEKQSSKGPMVLVIIESDYLTGNDELLCRVRRTYIRR